MASSWSRGTAARLPPGRGGMHPGAPPPLEDVEVTADSVQPICARQPVGIVQEPRQPDSVSYNVMVQERDTRHSQPQPPSSKCHGAPFPIVHHRSKSRFKARLEAQRAKAVAAGHEVSRARDHVPHTSGPRPSLVISGAEAREIHEANQRLLDSLSPEEMRQAQEEVRRKLGALSSDPMQHLSRLKSLLVTDDASGTDTTLDGKGTRATGEGIPEASVAPDTPTNGESSPPGPTNRYRQVPVDGRGVMRLDAMDVQKMRWMFDVDTSQATREPTSDPSEVVTSAHMGSALKDHARKLQSPQPDPAGTDASRLRFSLRGHLIQQGDVASREAGAASKHGEDEVALYHHGDEPDKPGYTVDELVRLSRAAVDAQASLALAALSRVVQRARRGQHGSKWSPLVLEYAFGPGNVVFLARLALDHSSAPLVTAALRLVLSIVALDGAEPGDTLGDMYALQPEAWKCPDRRVGDVWVDERRDLDDDDVIDLREKAREDPINALVHYMQLLPRLRSIIDMDQWHGVALLVLDILPRLAAYSVSVAGAIWRCPGLMDAVRRHFLTPQRADVHSGAHLEAPYGEVQVGAVRTLRLLCASSRDVCREAIVRGFTDRLKVHFLRSDGGVGPEVADAAEDDGRSSLLCCEALGVWTTCLTYGLEADLVPHVLPAVMGKLSRSPLLPELGCLSFGCGVREWCAWFDVLTALFHPPSSEGASLWPMVVQFLPTVVSSLEPVSTALLRLQSQPQATSDAGEDVFMLTLLCARQWHWLTSLFSSAAGVTRAGDVRTRAAEIVRDHLIPLLRVQEGTQTGCLFANDLASSNVAPVTGHGDCNGRGKRLCHARWHLQRQLLWACATLWPLFPELRVHAPVKLVRAALASVSPMRRASQTAASHRGLVLLVVKAVAVAHVMRAWTWDTPCEGLGVGDVYAACVGVVGGLLLPGDECITVWMLRNVLLHATYLQALGNVPAASQGQASPPVEPTQGDEVPPHALTKLSHSMDTFFIDFLATKNDLQRSNALHHMPGATGLHLTSLYCEASISRVKSNGGNIVYRMSSSLPWDHDWIAQPIAYGFEHKATLDAPMTEELCHSLTWILLLERCPALKGRAWMPTGTSGDKAIAVAHLFLVDDESFLDARIQAVLGALLHEWWTPPANLCWLCNAHTFRLCDQLVSQFVSASFGNSVFGHFVFMFLHQGMPPDYRRMVWNRAADVLHAVAPPPNCHMSTLEAFAWPCEQDAQVLRQMIEALGNARIGLGEHASTPFAHAVYWLAVHHVSNHMFDAAASPWKAAQTIASLGDSHWDAAVDVLLFEAPHPSDATFLGRVDHIPASAGALQARKDVIQALMDKNSVWVKWYQSQSSQ